MFGGMRAVVLLVLGTAMAVAYGDVIILAYYGVYFLLALALVRMSTKALAITAGLALVTPQLAFVLRAPLNDSVQHSINAFDPLKRLSDVGVLDLLLTGFYPTITWMPFVVAGMALGRLDVSAPAVQRRLAAFGSALTAVAYGASLLLAGAGALKSAAEDSSASSGGGSAGPYGTPSELLLAGPHSGTTFDIIGSVGVAILVIVGATVAMDRLPRLRRLARFPDVVDPRAHLHSRGDRVRRDLVPLPPPRTPGVPAQRRHQTGPVRPLRVRTWHPHSMPTRPLR